jgi:hypothetical protein
MAQRSSLEDTMQRLQELDQEMEQAWPGYTRLVEETTKGTLEAWHHQFILDYIKDVLHDQPEEFALARRRLEKEHQQLQAGKKKGENSVADGSARKETDFARLKRELQEQLADRKKRLAAPVEPRTEQSR